MAENPNPEPFEVVRDGVTIAGETYLDSGPGIDPASIRIDAGAVLWRNNGEERIARLR